MAERKRRMMNVRLETDTYDVYDRLGAALTGQTGAPFVASVLEQFRPQAEKVLAAIEAQEREGIPPLLQMIAGMTGGYAKQLADIQRATEAALAEAEGAQEKTA